MVAFQEHQLPQREDPVETPTRRTLKFKGEEENGTDTGINAHTANCKWPPLFLIPLLYSLHKKIMRPNYSYSISRNLIDRID